MYNGYHWLHIKQLRALYDLTSQDILRDYAEMWRAYIERWADMSIYDGVEKTARP